MLFLFQTLIVVFIGYMLLKRFKPKDMVCNDCYTSGKPGKKSGIFSSSFVCNTCGSGNVIPINTLRAKEIMAKKIS